MKKYSEGKITRTVETAEITVFYGLNVADDGTISAKHETILVYGVPAEETESYLRSRFPEYVQHRTVRRFFSRFIVPEQSFYTAFSDNVSEVKQESSEAPEDDANGSVPDEAMAAVPDYKNSKAKRGGKR